MGANVKTRNSPFSDPAALEWERYRARCRRYWLTRDARDKAAALAALSCFHAAFRGAHGAGVVVPFGREDRT